MNSIQVSRKPTKCQKCNYKAVVAILYGDPTEEAFRLSDEGKLVLGGYVILENSPDWECCSMQNKI